MAWSTVGEADAMLRTPWFKGCADEVEVFTGPVEVAEFSAEDRADERGDTEYAVFAGGLTVRGTLDLGSDVQSIYAVRGPLRVGRLLLGDAVLVVEGTVEAEEWIFGGDTAGVFDVNGMQAESPDRALFESSLTAPLVAVFDRARRAFILRENGVSRSPSDLLPALLPPVGSPDRPDLYTARRLYEHLTAAAPVFRSA